MEYIASNLDPYVNKTVSFQFAGVRMEYSLSQGVFSSYAVDEGSKLLLKTIAQNVSFNQVRDVADYGCGVGVLGVSLASKYPSLSVDMVDRSVPAVGLSQRNAELNRATGCHVFPGLGFSGLTGRYDLIVSNFPAKAGQPVIDDFLARAGDRLRSGGLVAVVFVAPLAEQVESTLKELDARILYKEATKSHVVIHYRGGTGAEGDEFEAYIRNSGSASFAGYEYAADTVYGLPEFDTLSFRSELLLDAVQGQTGGGNALFYNPGQGHLPCALAAERGYESCVLLSEDVLQLRATERNLANNGLERVTSIAVPHLGAPATGAADARGYAGPHRLALVSYDPIQASNWIDDAIRGLSRLAADSRNVVFASSSTVCHRLERALAKNAPSIKVTSGKKYHGQRVLRLRASRSRG